jgi:hypothetical protein
MGSDSSYEIATGVIETKIIEQATVTEGGRYYDELLPSGGLARRTIGGAHGLVTVSTVESDSYNSFWELDQQKRYPDSTQPGYQSQLNDDLTVTVKETRQSFTLDYSPSSETRSTQRSSMAAEDSTKHYELDEWGLYDVWNEQTQAWEEQYVQARWGTRTIRDRQVEVVPAAGEAVGQHEGQVWGEHGYTHDLLFGPLRGPFHNRDNPETFPLPQWVPEIEGSFYHVYIDVENTLEGEDGPSQTSVTTSSHAANAAGGGEEQQDASSGSRSGNVLVVSGSMPPGPSLTADTRGPLRRAFDNLVSRIQQQRPLIDDPAASRDVTYQGDTRTYYDMDPDASWLAKQLGNAYHRTGLGAGLEKLVQLLYDPTRQVMTDARNVIDTATNVPRIPEIWNAMPDYQKQDIAVQTAMGLVVGRVSPKILSGSFAGPRAVAPDVLPASVPLKRGPKIDPNAPHNATIRVHGDLLEAGGNTILAGGGKFRERLIPTPGGLKSARRPDILFETATGQLRGRNIGHVDAAGNPVKRELEALLDLNRVIPTDFVPF